MDRSLTNETMDDTLSIKFSLRNKLLILLLSVTLAVFLAVSYLGVVTIQSVGQTAEQVSGNALSTQAEQFLIELALDNARGNDVTLERIQADAQNVAQYASFIFSTPQAFNPALHWSAAENMFVGPGGQFINNLDDTSSVFVPNFVAIDDDVLANLELSAYLDQIFTAVYEGNPNVTAIYFINRQEISRLYPNIGLGQIVPPDQVTTQEIFYLAATPEQNPTKKAVWTPVYDDPAGQGLLVSTIAPVYLDNGEFFGIIGIDVSLTNLAANLEKHAYLDNAYTFLIDDQGRAISLPAQGYQDILGRSSEPDEFGTNLSNPVAGFASVLSQMQAGNTGFSKVKTDNGQELFVAYAPLQDTKWSLATVIDADVILQVANQLQQDLGNETTALIVRRLLPLGTVILVAVLVLGLWSTNRLIKPLRQLAVAAQHIGAKEWDTPLPPAGNDEVGLLTRTLKLMATHLRDLFTTLEDQVGDRTRGLELVAAVSGRLIGILNFDQLLDELIIQVKENFGYYYAHIYILDEKRQDLIMTAGYGQAGAQMKAKGHHILLNTPASLVARAARTGEIVNETNVRQSANWLPNPLLPDTYSEMAVPIIVAGQVAGVLDVQQDKVNGFNETDANLLRSLANQVAVAIRNARLFAEIEAALDKAQIAQERYITQNWQKSRLDAKSSGRLYIQSGVPELPESTLEAAQKQALAQKHPAIVAIDDYEGSPKPLVAPVSLAGQAIGTLQLHKVNGIDNNKLWTEQDLEFVETILDQVAQTAENLRLFDETRQQASREQVVREITDQLRASTNMEQLLKSAAEALGRRFSDSQIKLRLGRPTSKNNSNGQ